VAQYIADLCGGTPFDGFRSKADFEKIAVAVIDCGGTARVGVYPMKGVPTVDVYATKPSGPLFRFIKEENFVSGVTEAEVELLEGEAPAPAVEEAAAEVVKEVVEEVVEEVPEPVKEAVEEKAPPKKKRKGFMKALFGE
jgi:sorbitol-specific phosphotransferase system component IIBC